MTGRRDRSSERRNRSSRETGSRARSRSPSYAEPQSGSSRAGGHVPTSAIASAYSDRRRERDSDSQDSFSQRDGGRGSSSRTGTYESSRMDGPSSSTRGYDGFQGGRQQSSRYGDQRGDRGGRYESDGGRGFNSGGSYGRGRGFDRGRDGGGRDGGGRGGYRGPIISSGPPLPDFVPVPPNGAETNIPTVLSEGRFGEPIKVYTNHFEVQSLPCLVLYQYDIRVTGDKKEGEMDKEDVKQCSPAVVSKIMENPDIKNLLGTGFVFDGVSIGWSTTKLPLPNDIYRYRIDLPGRGGKPFRCNVDIKLSGTFSTDPFVRWVRENKGQTALIGNAASPAQAAHVHECLKFLNSLLRVDPSRRFISGQGNKSTTYFDRTPTTTFALGSTGGVLEAWRGFYQSTIIRFGKITVNVDTSTNAFIRPGINFVEAIAGLAGIPPDRLEDDFIQRPNEIATIIRKFLRVGFKCKHIAKGAKADLVRLVWKFTVKGAGEETFERKKFIKDFDGGDDIMFKEKITIAAYYLQQYNLKIRFPRLPMIETRKNEMYPMELCFVADGERWKETLQGAETADFIKFATGPAFLRKAQIEENLKKLAWHNQPELGTFGVSIKPQFMELNGRVLVAPIPQYHRGTEGRPPTTGRWNLKNKTFHTPAPVKGWGLICFPGGHIRPNEERLREFAANVNRSFSNYGMQVQRQDPPTAISNPQGDLRRTIAEMLRKVESLNGVRPNLIMFLLSVVSNEPYATIKSICDTEYGIASQCMVIEKAFNMKGQQQYLANISLKVNVKLGGVNSCINDPVISRRPTMVIGCDASHPNPSQRRMIPPPPTFTALSANYDLDCARFSAVTSVQEAGKEVVDKFGPMANELIRRFTRKVGREPETIFYFRDGVSEGEYSSVLSEELGELKKVTKAKITVIVCVKRHHTRIFPVVGGDKHGNVPPGTVIENGNGKDIFLVSHVGLQGTVRPTHYIVLYDENGLSVDHFQGLCNNLCYNYGRATLAVSLISPVYYAHLACERSRQHVKHDPTGKSRLVQVKESLKYSMWWQ